MANPQITFKILDVTDTSLSTGGSGLGFYGASFGTSVPLNAYQSTTFMTSADGQTQGAAAKNIKCIPNSVDVVSESGLVQSQGGVPSQLVKINGTEATLTIEFTNDTYVNVQNAQLRIYDRNFSINNPASGVNTKVCEIVNFDGRSYDSWLGSSPDISAYSGSGDALWWGSAWPSGYMYDPTGRPRYVNSAGITFYNFTDYELIQGTGNRDSRLTGIAGALATVGGTGIIVPLLDNPGTGGRNLISTGVFPKFTQYIKGAAQTSQFGVASAIAGTGVDRQFTYGGSGTSLVHTWRVGLSASPYTIGNKVNYGLYVSLEYLS